MPTRAVDKNILTRFGSSSVKNTDTESVKLLGTSQTTPPKEPVPELNPSSLTALVCENTNTMVDKEGQNEGKEGIPLEATLLGAKEPKLDLSPLAARVCKSTNSMVDKEGQNEGKEGVLLEATLLGAKEPKLNPSPLTALVCESTDIMVDKEEQNE
jgi:hypothetical protein